MTSDNSGDVETAQRDAWRAMMKKEAPRRKENPEQTSR